MTATLINSKKRETELDHSVETLLSTRRFTVVEHRVRRPDGTEANCPAVQHPGAVVILPILAESRVCLIRNYRLTVGSELIELPAGTREPDEPTQETARRELREETGYIASRLEKLAEFISSPGICDERIHAYLATGCQPGPPAHEANEQIENLVVNWAEALAMVDRGEIQDGKTVATLLLYDRAKNRSQ